MSYRDGPINVDVLRDALGIARAIYGAAVEMGPAGDDLRYKPRGVGYQLALAIERAGQGGPGTFSHRAAWIIAEEAIEKLGELVGSELPARALVEATGKRLTRKRG